MLITTKPESQEHSGSLLDVTTYHALVHNQSIELYTVVELHGHARPQSSQSRTPPSPQPGQAQRAERLHRHHPGRHGAWRHGRQEIHDLQAKLEVKDGKILGQPAPIPRKDLRTWVTTCVILVVASWQKIVIPYHQHRTLRNDGVNHNTTSGLPEQTPQLPQQLKSTADTNVQTDHDQTKLQNDQVPNPMGAVVTHRTPAQKV